MGSHCHVVFHLNPLFKKLCFKKLIQHTCANNIRRINTSIKNTAKAHLDITCGVH